MEDRATGLLSAVWTDDATTKIIERLNGVERLMQKYGQAAAAKLGETMDLQPGDKAFATGRLFWSEYLLFEGDRSEIIKHIGFAPMELGNVSVLSPPTLSESICMTVAENLVNSGQVARLPYIAGLARAHIALSSELDQRARGELTRKLGFIFLGTHQSQEAVVVQNLALVRMRMAPSKD